MKKEITSEEVIESLKNMKNEKAAGLNKMPPEMLKQMGEVSLTTLKGVLKYSTEKGNSVQRLSITLLSTIS